MFTARKTVNKFSPPKWLELAIVADYSVIDFHGSRVQQYLLALLNIVSVCFSFTCVNFSRKVSRRGETLKVRIVSTDHIYLCKFV